MPYAQYGSQPATAVQSEILRIEIHLLIDACDTIRWRLLLSPPQRQDLKATLQDVLLDLGECAGDLPVDPIASAQNCLLDAVLRHCASRCPAPTPMREAAS